MKNVYYFSANMQFSDFNLIANRILEITVEFLITQYTTVFNLRLESFHW